MPSDSTIPTSTPTPDLAQALRGLGLRLIAEQLDDFVAQATRRRASPRQLLEELARRGAAAGGVGHEVVELLGDQA